MPAERSLKVVSVLASVAALVLLGRLAMFMLYPAEPHWSFLPSSNWEVRHSCLSSYFVAAQAPEPRLIYDDRLYSQPGGDPKAPRTPRTLGAFNIDVYEYPPPFLLVPRLLAALFPDFLDFRLAWFVLNLGVLVLALWLVARAMGPDAGRRALLLAPLVLASVTMVSTLQKGNVQLVVIALSMLAMLQFERRRFAWGGALLAFATVSKLYPGMLVVYLLARQKWRAAAWTAAFGAVLALLTFWDLGSAPYSAFLEHLPKLLGGEAFPAFRNPASVAINYSVPGLVLKLGLLGVPGMTFAFSKVVGWIYTLVVLTLTWTLARRALTDEHKPIAWLVILFLATLRSPFLPQTYAIFPALWLLTLLAALAIPTRKTLAFVVLAWLALNVFVPIDSPVPIWARTLIPLLPQAVTVIIAMLAVRRRGTSYEPDPELAVGAQALDELNLPGVVDGVAGDA